MLSLLREWLSHGCCLILWCHRGSEEGLSWLHVSEELWASYAQLAMRWVGMALRACVCSRRGGSECVAVSLLAAAVLSGADCVVRVCCSALHVAGTLGMGAASGCNMRAAYCIHSG